MTVRLSRHDELAGSSHRILLEMSSISHARKATYGSSMYSILPQRSTPAGVTHARGGSAPRPIHRICFFPVAQAASPTILHGRAAAVHTA